MLWEPEGARWQILPRGGLKKKKKSPFVANTTDKGSRYYLHKHACFPLFDEARQHSYPTESLVLDVHGKPQKAKAASAEDPNAHLSRARERQCCQQP